MRNELEYRIQELENELESNKSAMMAMQLEFERRKTELESEHDRETSWLVRLHCACPTCCFSLYFEFVALS